MNESQQLGLDNFKVSNIYQHSAQKSQKTTIKQPEKNNSYKKTNTKNELIRIE